MTESMGQADVIVDSINNVVFLPFNNQEGVKGVERINQFSFYRLGQTLAAFQKNKNIQEDQPADFSFLLNLYRGRSELASLLSDSIIQLQVSKSAAQKLHDEMGKIQAEYFPLDENGFPSPGEKPIESWRLSHLTNALNTFETIFSEEMREAATYYVPRRGIYHTPALVDTADEVFPTDVLKYLPDKAKEDWKAAGRCLAFGLHTASGIHVARAVEGVLESYYQLFCNKPEGSTLKGWQAYYDALDKVQAGGKSPGTKTLAEFLQMKDDYRNPLMHPRTVLKEEDAHILFMTGASLIILMAQDMEVAQGQPPLALVSSVANTP